MPAMRRAVNTGFLRLEGLVDMFCIVDICDLKSARLQTTLKMQSLKHLPYAHPALR